MNAITTSLNQMPRWGLMWALVAVLFFGAKCLVWARATVRPAGWLGAAWWLLWPGMDADRFAVKRQEDAVIQTMLHGLTNLLFGAVLLWLVARLCVVPMVAGWVGMIGLIFILHFGIMHLLSSIWQRNGVSAVAVMKNPAGATSLAEFWGKRWNIAFRDLAHVFVFRPVARRWGDGAALWMTFFVSGLAHEIVISVPAGAGFGLPTVYFLIQALGMTVERGLSKRRPVVLKWLFTHGFTVLPLGLLFHPPFVQRVMLPLFRAIGALP